MTEKLTRRQFSTKAAGAAGAAWAAIPFRVFAEGVNGMDASHFLMLEVWRDEWILAGRRHLECQRGRASSSQANRRIRDGDYQNRGRGGYGEASVPAALG